MGVCVGGAWAGHGHHFSQTSSMEPELRRKWRAFYQYFSHLPCVVNLNRVSLWRVSLLKSQPRHTQAWAAGQVGLLARWVGGAASLVGWQR